MSIEITLGGALTTFQPEGTSGNSFSFDNTDSLTLSALLAVLGIPENQRMLVILNGDVVQPQGFGNTSLDSGDNLALMPPIAAG